MPLNINIGDYIEYTDENDTYRFFKGDKVTCCTKEKKYTGIIDFIGNYRETEETGYESAIYLDTSESKTSRSGKIIKLKDITSIYKNPFYHNINLLNEEQKVVDMFMDIGLSKEKAESAYNRMKDAVIYYNIPVVKAAAYAMKAIRYLNDNRMSDDREVKKNRLAEYVKECSDVAVKEYFRMLDIYIKTLEQDSEEALLYISDILDIVSKCWGDLMEQNNG